GVRDRLPCLRFATSELSEPTAGLDTDHPAPGRDPAPGEPRPLRASRTTCGGFRPPVTLPINQPVGEGTPGYPDNRSPAPRVPLPPWFEPVPPASASALRNRSPRCRYRCAGCGPDAAARSLLPGAA